ncbi:MAG: hypothetical protein JXA41_07710 [Deltaproteobacteria bacterium]|nr:hypothetical protein [Deltaproteobacteria bacterium]
MTISAYQVDNVIKAYNKQNKPKLSVKQGPLPDKFTDVVTISNNDVVKADAYKKISYSLMDILLKKND